MNKRIPIDQNVRDEIINSNHSNYLINASAGSGKTTILVDKAISLISNKNLKIYQNILMITFTRLATRQINEKIKKKLFNNEVLDKYSHDQKQMKVITTEGFVISEIIKPFLREVLGKNFPVSENIQENYSFGYKFDNFAEGLKQLKEKGILGSYSINENNFMYELGHYILKKSKNARKYLKAKYPYIMIDEYQDVDQEMHDLYMYLKNKLNIKLFIVGDIKQAIYGFRGADPEIFKSLKTNPDFKEFQLIENFRSCMSIVKYSYQFIPDVKDTDFGEAEENNVNFYDDADSKQVLKFIVNQYDNEQIVYLYARRNIYDNHERALDTEKFDLVEDLPLNTGHPDYYYFEPLIKQYFQLKNYNKFNVLDELGLNPSKHLNVATIENIVSTLKANSRSEDKMQMLEKFEDILNVNLSNEGKALFLKSLDKRYRINFAMEEYKRLSMTIHKSKGLEFKHVIIDSDSFFYWNRFELNNEFNKENHYVAITRPQKSLHIILNQSYKTLLDNLDIGYQIVNL